MSIREGFLASQRNLPLSNGLAQPNLVETGAIRGANHDLQDLFHQANTFHALGQTQKMVELCQEGIKKYPNNKELHFNQGYGFWKLGQNEAALTSYRRALEIDPDFSVALNNMGLVYLKTNDLENAKRCFQKATIAKQAIEDAWLNYAITLSRIDNKQEAMNVLRNMSVKFPNNKMAPLYRGHLHREFREIQDAASAYNQVLRIDPQNRDALLSLAVINTDVNQKGEAMDAYRRLTEAYPKDAEVWKLYGFSMRQFGDLDKSTTAFRTALNLDPNCVQTMMEQANNHLDKGESESAMALYDKILRVDPRQKQALVLKASILADFSNDSVANQTNKAMYDAKRKEAIACLDRAISEDSNMSDSFLIKGLVLKSMGDLEGAISNLSMAITRNNTCSIGYLARAALYYKTKQRTLAKEDVERLETIVMRNVAQSSSQAALAPQEDATRRFLEHYGEAENSLKSLSRSKTDQNRFGQLQARNIQKVLFLQAQNFERKTPEEYHLFTETMRRIADVDLRNAQIAASVFPPNSGTSPLEQYRATFLMQSEIFFEHFRDIFLRIEDPKSSDLKKPLAFIDLPTYAQAMIQKFKCQPGSSVLDTTLQEKSLPIYQFLRDHQAINNPQEETLRYLMFFNARNPNENEDLTLVNFQKLLGVILNSRDHQARIEKAASHPDMSDFKRFNALSQIEEETHQEFYADSRSDFALLGLHDALLIRSLMIFYRHKSELPYACNVHDEMAKFLLDRNMLFSPNFQFDKVGGSIINPLTSMMDDAHSLERPIMQVDTDPDRILNYIEVRKIKFQIYKNYTPFSANEVVLVFKDYPTQSVIYKLSNQTEMGVSGFVFPQRRLTIIDISLTINKNHKRHARVNFQNLVENEVWVTTEIYKDKPTNYRKNSISLFIVKKGI